MIRRLTSKDFKAVFEVFMEHEKWQGVPHAAHHWHEHHDGTQGASFYDIWYNAYHGRLQPEMADVWIAWGDFEEDRLLTFFFTKVWEYKKQKVATLGYICSTKAVPIPKTHPKWNDSARAVSRHAIAYLEDLGITAFYTLLTQANKKWSSSMTGEFSINVIEHVKAGKFPYEEDFFRHVMGKKFSTEVFIEKITRKSENKLESGELRRNKPGVKPD